MYKPINLPITLAVESVKGNENIIIDPANIKMAYSLYCYRTRLNDFIQEVYPTYFFVTSFKIKQEEQLIQYVVVLMEGDKEINPDEELRKEINEKIKNIELNKPKHCILLSSNTEYEISYGKRTISLKPWFLKKILPFLEYEDRFEYTLSQPVILDIFVLEGSVYLGFDDEVDYVNIIETLSDLILQKAINLYVFGSIVLNHQKDSEFINNWNLKPYGKISETQLFTCNWFYHLMPINMTVFLNQRIQSDYFRIRIDDDKIIRHAIAERFLNKKQLGFNYKYSFCGHDLFVKIHTKTDLSDVLSCVYSGIILASNYDNIEVRNSDEENFSSGIMYDNSIERLISIDTSG